MPYVHLFWDVPKFWWHAIGAVVRPLFGILGVSGILLALCMWVVRYLEHRFKKKTHSQAIDESKAFFRDTVWTPLVTYLFLLVFLSIVLGPYKLYDAEIQMVKSYPALEKRAEDLTQENATLKSQLSIEKAENAELRKKIPPETSLKIRLIRMANDLEVFYKNQPPSPTCTQTKDMTPEQQRAALEPCNKHENKIMNEYSQRFAPRIMAMVDELKGKGLNVLNIENCAPQGWCGIGIAVQLRAFSERLNADDTVKR
jgi:hypothetical protein